MKMKKLLSIALIFILTIQLCACADRAEDFILNSGKTSFQSGFESEDSIENSNFYLENLTNIINAKRNEGSPLSEEFTAAFYNFAAQLIKQTYKKENLIFSPLSVYLADRKSVV